MKKVFISGISGCNSWGFIQECAELGNKNTPMKWIPIRFAEYMYDADPENSRLKYEQWEEGILQRSNSLDLLRDAAFNKLIDLVQEEKKAEETSGKEAVLLLSTHATFWYHKSLLAGIEFNRVSELSPDYFVTITDDVLNIWNCIEQTDQDRWKVLSPIDILEWREIETFVTEQMAKFSGQSRNPKPFYLISYRFTPQLLMELIAHPERKKYYRSYPISFVKGHPEVQQQADQLGKKLEEYGIIFDPMAIKDYDRKAELQEKYINWCSDNKQGDASASWKEIENHLSYQTISRDHRLIDQSDGIVVYYPELDSYTLKDDNYVLSPIVPFSSGVLDEMQYAIQKGKEVLLVWISKNDPGPFLAKIYSKMFNNIDELMNNFNKNV